MCITNVWDVNNTLFSHFIIKIFAGGSVITFASNLSGAGDNNIVYLARKLIC